MAPHQHEDDNGEMLYHDNPEHAAAPMSTAEGMHESTTTSSRKSSSKKRGSRRNNHNNKVLVFDESGQTDADRRLLRKSQRNLLAQIDASSSLEDIEKLRDANNAILKEVRFTREAVLDAENNYLIASKLVQNAERLVQVPAFDPHKLMQMLARKCKSRNNSDNDGGGGGGGFLWKDLGYMCGVCFNSVPERVHFMAGPLDAELPDPKAVRRTRKPREPTAHVAEVVLQHIKEGAAGMDEDDKADRLSACEKTLKIMKHTLKKKAAAMLKESSSSSSSSSSTSPQAKPELCGVKFLMNPHSFTQTVENIFTYSFLIKKGEAAIGVHSQPGLGEVRGLYVAPRSNAVSMQTKQSVVAFNLRDWKRLMDGHNLTQGDMPHRSTKIQKRCTSADEEEN